MSIPFFKNLKLKINFKKFGIKKSELKKMIILQKWLENNQPTFTMKDFRQCDK